LQNSAFYLYPYFQFGSYDGSTNAPIAFPQGISMAALLAQMANPPSGVTTSSPWTPIINTNTAATGTAGGTVATGGGGTTAGGGGAAGGGGTAGGAAAAVRLGGGNSP